MIIVGKGILGLAAAEYFSRAEVQLAFGPTKICVVSSLEMHPPGSAAAGANLSTKGQLFARDPHFALKLAGKNRYPKWLNGLLEECGSERTNSPELSAFFRWGTGLDFFADVLDAQKQFQRVFQGVEALEQRGLPTTAVAFENEKSLRYHDEAWVDARFLLSLLEQVCRRRGVTFLEKNIECEKDLEQIYAQQFQNQQFQGVVLCPGASVLQLLKNLGFTAPPELKRAHRVTWGSTFVYSAASFHSENHAALCEDVRKDFLSKVTLSGGPHSVVASSTTVKIRTAEDGSIHIKDMEKNQWQEANKALGSHAQEFATRIWGEHPACSLGQPTVYSGSRIGFGHQEIVITKLSDKWRGLQVLLCAGAHKSGYLFAPVVGEQLSAYFQRL